MIYPNCDLFRGPLFFADVILYDERISERDVQYSWSSDGLLVATDHRSDCVYQYGTQDCNVDSMLMATYFLQILTDYMAIYIFFAMCFLMAIYLFQILTETI